MLRPYNKHVGQISQNKAFQYNQTWMLSIEEVVRNLMIQSANLTVAVIISVLNKLNKFLLYAF